MSTTRGDDDFEAALEVEVEAELNLAESSHAEEIAQLPVSQWLFDPVEEQQYEIELRGLLDSVRELEGERRDSDL